MTRKTTHTTPRSTGPHLKDQDRPDSPQRGDTTANVYGEPAPRMPHERDESSDSQDSAPRRIIEQARRDIVSGQKDTDKGPPLDETYRRLK